MKEISDSLKGHIGKLLLLVFFPCEKNQEEAPQADISVAEKSVAKVARILLNQYEKTHL